MFIPIPLPLLIEEEPIQMTKMPKYTCPYCKSFPCCCSDEERIKNGLPPRKKKNGKQI